MSKSQIDDKYISHFYSKPADSNYQIRLQEMVREASQQSNELKVSRKRSNHSKENRLIGMMDDWPSKFKNILAESNVKNEQ